MCCNLSVQVMKTQLKVASEKEMYWFIVLERARNTSGKLDLGTHVIMSNLFPSLNSYFVLALLSHRLSLRAVKEGVLVSFLQINRAKGTQKADGVIQRLTARELTVSILGWVWRSKNPNCWEQKIEVLTQRIRWNVNAAFLYHFVLLGSQWVRWAPPTLGRAVFFPQSTNSKANLLLEHLQAHPEIICSQLSGHPGGPIQLTHKINHHKSTPC